MTTSGKMSLRGASVVVTGGAGFIGSHLVDRLVREDPRRIDVIDDLWLGRRANLRDAVKRGPVRLHVVDATKLASVHEVMRRARTDVVFDLATIPLPASLVRPRWAYERIVRLATVCAELARLGAYQTLIHCSSSEVYGTAIRVPMSERHPSMRSRLTQPPKPRPTCSCRRTGVPTGSTRRSCGR